MEYWRGGGSKNKGDEKKGQEKIAQGRKNVGDEKIDQGKKGWRRREDAASPKLIWIKLTALYTGADPAF